MTEEREKEEGREKMGERRKGGGEKERGRKRRGLEKGKRGCFRVETLPTFALFS